MLVDTSDSRGTVFEQLVEEHREILAMLAATLELDPADMIERRAAFARLARVIRIHERAEEEVVFPRLDGSWELGHRVRADKEDHRAIDEQLRAIERTEATGDEWRARVKGLRLMLEQHFADEENVIFPRAHCVIGDADAHVLLAVWDQEREFLARQLG